MIAKRQGLRLVPLLALMAVPLAAGMQAVVRATGAISGPDENGYYSLTARNTGDQEIRCLRLFVREPVLVTGAQSLPGWQLGASRQPPAPDIGARALGAGLAAGQSITLKFRTDRAYPVNGGGELRVSADCVSDVSGPATGPPAPPPPPKPKPKPKP